MTKILIGPVEHRRWHTNGAGISPTLAIGAIEKTLKNLEASFQRAWIGMSSHGRHPCPSEDQRVDQRFTLGSRTLNPSLQDQTQLAGSIQGHGLMQIHHTAHTFNIGQDGKFIVERDCMQPNRASLIHTKPDIVHRLSGSVHGLILAHLQMLIPLRIRER